jgi:hypothetical protein
MRQQFNLPQEDMEWLETQGKPFELVEEGGVLRSVLYGIPIPDGYNVAAADAHVRIEAGYPDTQIDMIYFTPSLALKNGKQIGALSSDTFDSKEWQRWSRHRTGENPWRPGIDNLATHFALALEWLEREARAGT